MRQYERNDVIIDQCTECGGVFLDRGELERLAQAEANFYNPQAAQPLPPRADDDRKYAERRRDDPADPHDSYYRRDRDDDYRRPGGDREYRDDDRRYREDKGYREDRRYDDRRYEDRRYDDGRYRDGDRRYGKRRKREGFFGELMDMLD